MSASRCSVCIGSGTVMGGGMMMRDCRNCDGTGKILANEEFHDIMHKDSDEYKNSKNKIKSLKEGMTDEEAEKLLDDELENQTNGTETKRKRKESARASWKANRL